MTKTQKVNLIEGTIFIALMAYGYYRHPVLDFWTISSGLLFIVGAALGVTARHELAECFSGTPKAKRIVRSGVYSKIHHPIYIGGLLICISLCLLYRNLIFYSVLLVAFVIQSIRARAEEKILTEKFGQDYLDYKKSTWF
jgi:protein-S-isoprenylcysteine O-methyltransferase Ste14